MSTVFTERAVTEVGGSGSPIVNTWEAATSGSGNPTVSNISTSELPTIIELIEIPQPTSCFY